MSINGVENIVKEMQDYLMPKLDSYEQMLYHFFFRHTFLEKKTEIVIGTRALQTRIGLGIGKAGSPPSQKVVSAKIRSLEEKGCISVSSRSARGTSVKVFLPSQIIGLISTAKIEFIEQIEDLDFFKNIKLRENIIRREQCLCFYCLRRISKDNYALDHVQPQVLGGDNSYRNIVATCFECNSRKQSKDVKEFILGNYREGLLNKEEYASMLKKIDDLKKGLLIPDIEEFT